MKEEIALELFCCQEMGWLETFDPGKGGGLPYKKDEGASRKFWKEPLTGTKMLFCGLGLKFFSPNKRYRI